MTPEEIYRSLKRVPEKDVWVFEDYIVAISEGAGTVTYKKEIIHSFLVEGNRIKEHVLKAIKSNEKDK